MKYETVKELEKEKFRRLTGVKQATFNRMIEILDEKIRRKTKFGKLIINLFYKAEDFFLRSISSKCFEFDGKAKAYLTGIDSDDLNPLIVRENIPNINEVLDSCSRIFKKMNCHGL